MKANTNRREFLKTTSAALGLAATGGFTAMRYASAAALEAPTVDNLSIRVLVDSSFDLFFRPAQVNGVSITPPPRVPDFRRTLHNEWGLSLWLESQRAAEERTMMLDYGYSQNVLYNNMELIGVDPRKLDALIISHGHYDHFGGLMGFLDKYRARNCRPTSSSTPAAKTTSATASTARPPS